MAALEMLNGADVLVFENGDVSLTGTTPEFVVRSLVRAKGAKADWMKSRFN